MVDQLIFYYINNKARMFQIHKNSLGREKLVMTVTGNPSPQDKIILNYPEAEYVASMGTFSGNIQDILPIEDGAFRRFEEFRMYADESGKYSISYTNYINRGKFDSIYEIIKNEERQL